MSDSNKKVRGRFTGAWKKEGPYGTFYKGKFKKAYLLEQIAQFPDDINDFDVYISKLDNKSKETDPDLVVSFEPHVPYNKG